MITVSIYETSRGVGNYPLQTKTMQDRWGMKPSRRMLVIEAKRMAGLTGLSCIVTETPDGLTITCKQANRCVTVGEVS